MQDEQPLCQDLTERRRTTVRFLGQQSEMTIDDTWPQAGEMRSLWKGTTEFWRHLETQQTSQILPLFRNHLTRNAVAISLHLRILLPRLSMGAKIPICPPCHTSRIPRKKGEAWFRGCQNYPTCTAPTTTTPPVPQILKTLLLKQQTQAVNDRTPAKGCRHLLVKPWANGTGKGNCGAIISDKGEITGTSKSIQRKLVTDEEKRHSSRTVEGRTELDLVQEEVDEAKRLLEEAHVEVQAAQSKVTEAAFRVGQAMEEMPDQETVGGELGTSWSMRTGQKKRLLGGNKKTKVMWVRWYEAILEEEKLQSNKGITVQRVDFCEAYDVESACSSAARPFRLAIRNLPATHTCSGGDC